MIIASLIYGSLFVRLIVPAPSNTASPAAAAAAVIIIIITDPTQQPSICHNHLECASVTVASSDISRLPVIANPNLIITTKRVHL